MELSYLKEKNIGKRDQVGEAMYWRSFLEWRYACSLQNSDICSTFEGLGAYQLARIGCYDHFQNGKILKDGSDSKKVLDFVVGIFFEFSNNGDPFVSLYDFTEVHTPTLLPSPTEAAAAAKFEEEWHSWKEPKTEAVPKLEKAADCVPQLSEKAKAFVPKTITSLDLSSLGLGSGKLQ